MLENEHAKKFVDNILFYTPQNHKILGEDSSNIFTRYEHNHWRGFDQPFFLMTFIKNLCYIENYQTLKLETYWCEYHPLEISTTTFIEYMEMNIPSLRKGWLRLDQPFSMIALHNNSMLEEGSINASPIPSLLQSHNWARVALPLFMFPSMPIL